jgi:predicted negative regulator of RcsB-dependent stress response
MAAYDLEEQEQLDELKTWWKQYGNLVTALVTAVAVIAVAWQGWNWWQRSQSAQASAIFAAVQQAATQRDAKRTRELAGELIDKYPRTAYAGMAALLSARIQVDAGDPKSGLPQLGWAAEHADDQSVRDLARLRLAALFLDLKAYDEAMTALARKPLASFEPRFTELKGDVLAAQGKVAEARAAYDEALTKLSAVPLDAETQKRNGYLDLVQAKRDSLGAGK